MAMFLRILVLVLALISGLIYKNISHLFGAAPQPNLPVDQWWGAGEKPLDWEAYLANTSQVISNKISYPEARIEDLRNQLSRKFNAIEPLEGVGFEYGFNSRTLKKVIDYWRDNYLPRWREREVFLWQFNHFTTEIQGLRMHFIHLKAYEEQKVGKQHYPVLLLHGWPGSVREFYALVNKMQNIENHDPNNKYVFDIVVPSLPGYGWSQGTSKQGMGVAEYAVVMRNLMLRLGYNRFFVQGGDWGSIIGSHIATLFPQNVIGYHSNMCSNLAPKTTVKGIIASLLPTSFFAPEGCEDFFYPQSEKFEYLLTESGYFHIQATKPDTIGSALTDNPIGLAAYILEKFSTWTNSDYRKLEDGGLTKRFQLDSLLDNVMIYYLTNSITTSQRLYAESFSKRQLGLHLDKVPTNVPTACARFKQDLMHLLDFQLRDKYPNLLQSTYHKEGGHFAAMEVPDLLYADFIEFIKKVEKINKNK